MTIEYARLLELLRELPGYASNGEQELYISFASPRERKVNEPITLTTTDGRMIIADADLEGEIFGIQIY